MTRDQDYHGFLLEQISHLEKEELDELSSGELVDLLLEMSNSNRHEVENFLSIVIQHILKWENQPSRRTTSWRRSVINSGAALKRIFRDSETLYKYARKKFPEIYAEAKKDAEKETGVEMPSIPPYSFEQFADNDFTASLIPIEGLSTNFYYKGKG